MKNLVTFRFRLFIVMLIAVVAFTTCRKEDDKPAIYSAERSEIQPIRLFTANEEITDQHIVVNFINRHTAGHNIQVFITNLDTIIDVADKIKIEYLSANTATFTYFGESSFRNVTTKNNVLYFEASDTTTIYHQIGGLVWLQDFLSNMSTYRPLYSEFQELPLSTGWRGLTKLRHCFFLEKKNQELAFPSFFIMHIRNNESGIPEQRAILGNNNDFNTGAAQYLSVGDTIALQQSAVILEKRPSL